MDYQNRLRIDLAFHDLSPKLLDFVEATFSDLRSAGKSWTDLLREQDIGNSNHTKYFEKDPALLLRMITDVLGSPSHKDSQRPSKEILETARRLRRIRNAWAHHNPISDDDVRRTDDDCRVIVNWIKSTKTPQTNASLSNSTGGARPRSTPKSAQTSSGRPSDNEASRPKKMQAGVDPGSHLDEVALHLDKWWQQVLSATASEVTKDLLPLLTVSVGPLTAIDLRTLVPRLYPASPDVNLQSAFFGIGRIVTGDESAGYVLSGPFVSYLRQKFTQRELDFARRKLLDYSSEWFENGSRYALSTYPMHLAELADPSLLAIFSDFGYVEHAVRRLGIDDVTKTMQNILNKSQLSETVRYRIEQYLMIFEREAHHLRKPFPVQEIGYIARQLALQALGGPEVDFVVKAREYLKSIGSGQLVPLWLSDRPSPQLKLTLFGHAGAVTWGKITADGARVVTGDDNGTVRVWELSTGATLQTLEGHTSWVTAGAITSDGTRALTVDVDGMARLWDLTTGATLHVLTGSPDPLNVVVITTDGTRAVTAGADGTARVWDLRAGKLIRVLMGHEFGVTAIALTPDDARAVTADDEGNVRIWDLTSGTSVPVVEDEIWPVKVVAITPDGERVVLANARGTIRVLDLESGSTVYLFNSEGQELETMAISPDGSRAISADAGRLGSAQGISVRVWDLTSGTLIRVLVCHETNINAVAITREGNRAVAAGADGTARVWNLNTGATIHILKGHATADVADVAITPDGRYAVTTGSDGTARVWDLAIVGTSPRSSGHTDAVSAIELTNDGTRAVTAGWDGTVRLWDIATGAEVHVLKGSSQRMLAVALPAHEKFAVTAGWDNHVRVWQLMYGMVDKVLDAGTWQNAVSITPDGSLAITAGDDGVARIWDLEAGILIRELTGHKSELTGAVITPEGHRAITTSRDGTIRVWDVDTGNGIYVLGGESGRPIKELTATPDGTFAATVSFDGAARFWDIPKGELAQTVEARVTWLRTLENTGSAGLRSVALTHDGAFAVTKNEEAIARVWNMKTGRSIRLRGHAGEVTSVTVTPDGTHALTSSIDGTIRLWNMASGEQKFAVAVSSDVSCLGTAQCEGRTIIVCGQVSGALMVLALDA
jgi:WD40 repeat protein